MDQRDRGLGRYLVLVQGHPRVSEDNAEQFQIRSIYRQSPLFTRGGGVRLTLSGEFLTINTSDQPEQPRGCPSLTSERYNRCHRAALGR